MIRVPLKGNAVSIRPIVRKDAEYMRQIRNCPKNNKYLSNREKKISLNEQLNWMNNHYLSPDSIDFIIEINKNLRSVGCIAIYDIANGTAELGRYIAENPLGALEGELLALKYAFEKLNIEKIYCKTVIKNIKVWEQHLKLGFFKEGEDFDSRIQEKRVLQYLTKEMYLSWDYSKYEKIILNFS